MAFARSASVVLAAAAALIAPAALAQDGPEAVARATAGLIAILNGAGAPDPLFAPKFLASVPEPQLRQVAADVAARLGRATGYRSVVMREPRRAEIVIAYERGTAHGGIVVEPGAGGRIVGFWIDAIEPADVVALHTLDAVSARFSALPGVASFLVAKVDSATAVAPLTGHAAERPLAIGSAFKLVVLADLVRAVETGEREWDDRITIGHRELPAGLFRAQPAGTKVSLRKLAEEMIRVSDNSATDLLLHELGRERVEAMQAAIGWTHRSANVPFLSTMEAFKLKGVESGALGRRYLAADEAERRRLLDTDVASRTGADVGALFADGRPVMIDCIEWFASAADLARTMAWFAARADRPAGAEALRILALNPGPAASLREQLGYIGYKGGSEPGVLNMTTLVRTATGGWHVVVASWNDPDAPVDEARFAPLVTRALAILAG